MIDKSTFKTRLTGYTALDSIEQEYLLRFHTLLDTIKHPFYRDTSKDHITVSAILFCRDDMTCYQIWHSKIGKWLQPGGHVERSDDTLHTAALRELLEETGFSQKEIDIRHKEIFDLDINVIKSSEEEHEHYDVRFAFSFVGLKAHTPDSTGRWIAIHDLIASSDESQSRYAKKLCLLSEHE
jgi:8-oxo-dGTP pyrophosphatase MutT (NUDIX family)